MLSNKEQWPVQHHGITTGQTRKTTPCFSVADLREAVRIDRLKHLLVYTPLSREEICEQLRYSSVDAMEADLIEQTGLNIEFYEQLKEHKIRAMGQWLVSKIALN
jgi:hypothetical protein